MHKKPGFLVAVVIGLLWCLNAYAQYSVQSIPNPRHQGNDHYVSDPDGNLGNDTRARLDAIGAGLGHAKGSDVAVAIVNAYQGERAFEASLAMVYAWGNGYELQRDVEGQDVT